MEDYLVGMNFAAAIFLLIILLGHVTTNKNRTHQDKWFSICIGFNIIGLVTNSLSFILNNVGCLCPVLHVIVYISFITVDLLLICFAYYLYYVIRDYDPTSTLLFVYSIVLICIVDMIWLTIGTIANQLFYVSNCHYYSGPLADFISIGPSICLISFLIEIFIHRKKVGLTNFFVLSGYILLEYITAVIQMITKVEFGYLGCALALLIIYVCIQSKTITETKNNVRIYNELSTQDELTGLKNRRGYQQLIQYIKMFNNVGAVYCDLNSLKDTNDHYGHDSGDKLILKFSVIIHDFFIDDYVCRVSGDEFIILMKNPSEQYFNEKMEEFKRIIIENDNIASFGYSIGEGKDILTTVNEAEHNMYIDKDRYYKLTGKNRRS